jgi:hypothetical protein
MSAINFSETVLAAAKANMETARIAFEAGHKAGYVLGYKEGFAAAMTKAQEVISAAFPVKP